MRKDDEGVAYLPLQSYLVARGIYRPGSLWDNEVVVDVGVVAVPDIGEVGGRVLQSQC